MNLRFFGIEIEKRTDILALAAFILSMGSLLAQCFNIVRGPEVVLDGPKIITLYSHVGGDGKRYLRLAATLTYLNNGSPGYDDILKSEVVTVSTETKTIKLNAKYYINSKSSGKKMTTIFVKDAVPMAIKSGSVYSHETEFIPFPDKTNKNSNYVEIKRFIEQLRQSNTLLMTFFIETYKGQKITKKCHLKPQKVAKYLNDKERSINGESSGWSSNICTVGN